jgi:hypothetical protein
VKLVRIENLTRTMQVLNLPHSVVPELATMGVRATLEGEPRVRKDKAAQAAAPGLRVERLPISGAITLLPKGNQKGSTRDGLPLSVLKAPEIAAARGANPARIKVTVYDPNEKGPKPEAQQVEARPRPEPAKSATSKPAQAKRES